MFEDINQPYAVAQFLEKFKKNKDMLYKYIYSEPYSSWFGKGIEYYEKLGDLQGSGLLQSEEAIRKSCRILSKKCKENNIKYLELRCSPQNYTKGGMDSEEVVNTIIDELKKDKNCYYSIMFIASRHGKMETVKKHIELAQNMLTKNAEFKNWFAGFDLAGAEAAKSPEEFRELFLPLMERCINITIHAGEGEDAENIWKAVYHLNADRIGHGLTLKDKPELMSRFIDRKIAIEMCPSSNYQIVGFKDYRIDNSGKNIYPLKEYLDKGIYVTINTDDP
jgi:adenosine deaminase